MFLFLGTTAPLGIPNKVECPPSLVRLCKGQCPASLYHVTTLPSGHDSDMLGTYWGYVRDI